ncbi:MAG: hypothetical protein F6K21_04465, partial [Symploca sp. SIO2D2]|nr:hypothetical protein [Symploca sp. SIO2D2]
MLTTNDQLLTQWFAAISSLVCQSSNITTSKVWIEEKVVIFQSSSRYLAYKVSLQDELIKKTGYGLKILWRDEQFLLIPPASTTKKLMPIIQNTTLQNSSWAKMNSSALELMSDDGTVSIFSTNRDAGYQLLTVCPYMGIEETLCLPKEQLVGKAILDAWDKSR